VVAGVVVVVVDDVESLDLVVSEPELVGVDAEPSEVLPEPRLSVL